MESLTNKNIQNEIVKMEFDGRNFEKNVQDSIKTIELLNKEILGLSKASFNFQKIEDSSKELKLDGITKAVDNVNDRFSLMGNVVQRVYRDIADSTVNLVKHMTTSFLSISNPFGFFDTVNMKIGLKKYEDYNNAIRTMYNNLAADAKYAWMEQEELMEHIEDQMDYITTYSDETNAAIDKVVEAVSKLTNAGEGLEEAQKHVVGYTNLLGSAGFSVEEINNMYDILDGITSSGRIMTRQYMMIAKTFTPQVRKLLLEYAALEGTLTDLGGGLYETNTGKKPELVTVGKEFRGSLNRGWLTSSVYERVLEEYAAYYDAIKNLSNDLGGEEAGYDYTTTYNMFNEMFQGAQNELKDLYQQLGYSEEYFNQNIASLQEWQKAALDSTRQAKTFEDAWLTGLGQIQVGWKNTFTIIFGNVLEAEKLWTELANELYDFFYGISSWRNSLLRMFKDLGGIEYVLGSIANILKVLRAIFNSFSIGIREAFSNYINVEILAGIAEGFYNITDSIYSVVSVTEDEVEHINSLTQVIKLISNAVAFIFSIIGKGISIISPIFKIASNILYLLIETIGHISEIINLGFDSFISNIINQLSNITIIEDILNGINYVISNIVKSLNNILTYLKNNLIINNLSSIFTILNDIVNIILGSSNTILKDIVELVVNMGNFITKTFVPVGKLLKNVFVYSLNKIKDSIIIIFKKILDMKIIENIIINISHLLLLVIKIFVSLIKNVVYLFEYVSKNFEKINELVEKIKKIEIIQKIGEKILNTWDKIKDIFEKIKTYIKNIDLDSIIEKVNIFSNKISNIFNNLGQGKIDIKEAVSQIFGEIKNAFTFLLNSIEDFFIKIDLKTFLSNFINNIPNIIIFISSFIYNAIDTFLNNILDFLNDKKNIDKVADTISNIISNIINVILNIFSKIQSIGPALKEIISKIDFSPILSIIDNIKTVAKEFFLRADLVFKSIINAFNNLFGTNLGLITVIITSISKRWTISGIARTLERDLSMKWFFEGVAEFLKSIALLVAEVALIAVAIKKNAIDKDTLSLATEVIVTVLIFVSTAIILIGNLAKGSESMLSDFYGWANTMLRLVPFIGLVLLIGTAFAKIHEAFKTLEGQLKFVNEIISTLVLIFGSIIIGAIVLGKALEILSATTHTLIPSGYQVIDNTKEFLNIVQSVGILLAGVSAFILSLYLIQFLDPTVIAEKIKSIAWTIFGVVSGLLLVVVALKSLAAIMNIFTKGGLSNLPKDILTEKGLFQSISSIVWSIGKILVISFPLDSKVLQEKLFVLGIALLEIVAFTGLLGLISKSITKNQDIAKNFKFMLKMVTLILGEIIVLLFAANMVKPEAMEKFSLMMLVISGSLVILMYALSKIAESITKLSVSNISSKMKITSMVLLIIGIGAILFEMAAFMNILKDMDLTQLQSSIPLLITVFLGVGGLAAVLAAITKFIKPENLLPMYSIIGGIALILLTLSGFIGKISKMNFTQLESSIPLLITVFLGVGGLAAVLAAITKFIKPENLLPMYSIIGGVALILLEMSGFMSIISKMNFSQLESSIPLLITVFLGVDLLALALAGAAWITGINYAGLALSIVGISVAMYGIYQILSQINEMAKSGALNTEAVKSFKDIMIILGIALGAITLVSTVLGVTGFAIAAIPMMLVFAGVLIALAEAFKIFSEGAIQFGNASMLLANAFKIFAEGCNSLTEAFERIISSIQEFILMFVSLISELGAGKVLAISGSILALSVALGGLTLVLVPFSVALGALTLSLSAFNVPFKTFIDTLAGAYTLGKDIFDAARNFINGFTGGIKQGKNESFNTGKELGTAAIEGLNEGTDSHSPSRLAKINGEYFVIGMIEGMEVQMPLAKEKAEQLGVQVTEGLENSVELSYDQMKSLGYNTADKLINAIDERLKNSDDLEVDVIVKLKGAKSEIEDWKNRYEKASEDVYNYEIKHKNILDRTSDRYTNAFQYVNDRVNKEKIKGYQTGTTKDEDVLKEKIADYNKLLENKDLSEQQRRIYEFNKKQIEDVVSGVNKTGKYIEKQLSAIDVGTGNKGKFTETNLTRDVHSSAEAIKKNATNTFNNYNAVIEEYNRTNDELTELKNKQNELGVEGWINYGATTEEKQTIINRIASALDASGIGKGIISKLKDNELVDIYSKLKNGFNITDALSAAGIDLASLGLGGGNVLETSSSSNGGRLGATTNFLVEAQNEVKTLSDLYKKFGQDESTAMTNAQNDTKTYYDYLYQLAKQQDENFDMITVGTGEFDSKGKEKTIQKQIAYEDALTKVFNQTKQNIKNNISSQYDAFGFSKVDATTPKMDYATARRNLDAQNHKIEHFVNSFEKLAKAGLSSDLANVIAQEGYWNSPTFAMLDSMSDKEIQKYQDAMRLAKEKFEKFQDQIAKTQMSIDVSSYKKDEEYKKDKILKDYFEDLKKQLQENVEKHGLSEEDAIKWWEDEKKKLGYDKAGTLTFANGKLTIVNGFDGYKVVDQDVETRKKQIEDLKKQLQENVEKHGLSQEDADKYYYDQLKKLGWNEDGTLTVGNGENKVIVQNDNNSYNNSDTYHRGSKLTPESTNIEVDKSEYKEDVSVAHKKDPNRIENSNLYQTISDWVKDADIDPKDQDVADLIKEATKKDLYTYEAAKEFLEPKLEQLGWTWQENEIPEDDEEDVYYSTNDKGGPSQYSTGVILASDDQSSKKSSSKITKEVSEEGQVIGSTIVDGVSNALQEESPSMIENVMNTTQPIIIDSLINMLTSLLQNSQFLDICKQIGNAISAGISVGMSEGKDDAKKTAEGVARDTVEALGPAAEVHSPSRYSQRIGKFIAEGLAIGIKDNAYLGTNAATEMAENTMYTFQSAFDNIHNIVANEQKNDWSITPVVNMDDIEDANKDIDKLFSNHDVEMIASNKKLQNEEKNLQQNANSNQPTNYTFTQNNYSPKSLSRGEIYRQTKNLFNTLKNK